MVSVEVVLDASAAIGESPTWCAGDASLYWIDIKGPALHQYYPGTGERRWWPLSADVGAFALTAGLDGAVVALRTGLFRLDFGSGSLAPLAPPPFDPALHRFNEGACDVSGRFWVGSMFDPLQPGSQPPVEAGLFSFTFGGGLRHEPDAAVLHNGMAWSPDGRQFYLSHSQSREVHVFAFDPVSGSLGGRRVFATIADDLGLPDGAAVDAEGGYWCAVHGGGRLRRFTAGGAFDRDIRLPVSKPTMCAFAGEGLDDLYVTSASEGLSPEQREAEPHAGALLRLRPGVQGIPRCCTVR